MKKDTLNNYEEGGLPKRVDKALAWIADSRNKWKEKCMDAKLKLKRLTQEHKRVKDSRRGWKLHNDRLQFELNECKRESISLQNRIDELESQLECKISERNQFKKKR
jgi:hypothetical protein